MGIRGLNKWLKTHIGASFIKQIPQIHTLFIDAKQSYYKSLDLVKDEKNIIPVFLAQIQKIIEAYTPIDTLFLAMDGPNPAAKFQTQRERKFRRDYKPDFKYPKEQEFQSLFDSEHYDEAVNLALIDFLQQQIQRTDIQSKEFLFSSGYAAGESEHKYFQYFREQKNSNKWVPNRNHFIVSNDNDLIFLSLQFTDENFYIIKIWNFNDEEKVDFVDITKVRQYFLGLIHSSLSGITINETKVINDIIALSFLLGNDFIPSFPEIKSFDIQSFQRLLDTYALFNKNNNSNYQYLIENDCFNVTNLKSFISLLFQNDHRSFPNNFDQNELKEMAQMILRIFNFTWIYYSKGVPSWSFYYPFLTAPSLKMIAPLFVQEDCIQFFNSLQNDEVTDPYLKKLIIRPAYSTSNIPWNIYKLKIPPSEMASKYWPMISPSEKVPMFNLSEIVAAYKKEVANLTPEESKYNRRDPPYFVYSKSPFHKRNKEAKRPHKNTRFHYSYE